MARFFNNSNATYLATVGAVRATASWLVNATSIAVPAGLTFIANGAPIYDTSIGVGVAGLIGTVTGYSGTTLSTSSLSSASVGSTDSLLIGNRLLPLLGAGFPLTVSAWFKCPSNPTNNEVIFDMGGGGASANAMRLYLSWNSPQLILGVEPVNNNNATYSNKASGSFAISAGSVTLSSPAGSNNTDVLPGQTVYSITASALVGTVGSFNPSTSVLTFTSGGATHASSGASDLLQIGTQISLNQWHHGGGVVTGTGQSAYLDGVLTGQSTSTNTFPTAVNVATIGAQQNNSISFPFTGHIGRVCAWSVALTPLEMSLLAAGVPEYLIQPASIIGCWIIDGISKPELDWSGNLNPMAVNGSLAASNDLPPVFDAFDFLPGEMVGGLNVTSNATLASFALAGALTNLDKVVSSKALGAFTLSGTLTNKDRLLSTASLAAFTLSAALTNKDHVQSSQTLANFALSGTITTPNPAVPTGGYLPEAARRGRR